MLNRYMQQINQISLFYVELPALVPISLEIEELISTCIVWALRAFKTMALYYIDRAHNFGVALSKTFTMVLMLMFLHTT